MTGEVLIVQVHACAYMYYSGFSYKNARFLHNCSSINFKPHSSCEDFPLSCFQIQCGIVDRECRKWIQPVQLSAASLWARVNSALYNLTRNSLLSQGRAPPVHPFRLSHPYVCQVLRYMYVTHCPPMLSFLFLFFQVILGRKIRLETEL